MSRITVRSVLKWIKLSFLVSFTTVPPCHGETQFWGYRLHALSPTYVDNTTNRTLLPSPMWTFPSDGSILGFDIQIHREGLDNIVKVQIWRHINDSEYELVGESVASNSPTTGFHSLEPAAPINVQRGDTLGLFSVGKNPVPFQYGRQTVCTHSAYWSFDGHVTGMDIGARMRFRTESPDPLGCRNYLVRAEYEVTSLDTPLEVLGDTLLTRGEPETFKDDIIIPNPESGFPADGVIVGWKSFAQHPMKEVVFQVWRHLPEGLYTLVHVSGPFTYFTDGYLHVRLPDKERTHVREGDVIAISFREGNPLNFDWSRSCDDAALHVNTTDLGRASYNFVPIEAHSMPCRKYSFQAEYFKDTPHDTSNVTRATTPRPSVGSLDRNFVEFGWDAPHATDDKDVKHGTLVPDVGTTFPHNGLVVGWAVNISTLGSHVGFQIWRPLPAHPNTNRHGRDFKFVGETKPFLPWHLGENRFMVEQIGEKPIEIQAGDVIGMQVNTPLPVAYVKARLGACAGRFYMSHFGRNGVCDIFMMERANECNIYGIKALVVWEKDNELKPLECKVRDPLAPLPLPGSHIDSCLILTIKSPEATYQLTNPGYPNITKHHDICWVIHLDPALYSRLYIQVTIKELDLRAPNNCSTYASDYLEFRDGEWLKSPLLRRYCVGWPLTVKRTDTVTACHHFLYVRMRASATSFGFKGFLIHYGAIEEDPTGGTCRRQINTVPLTSRKPLIVSIIVIVIGCVVTASVVALYLNRKKENCCGHPCACLKLDFLHHRFDNADTESLPGSPRRPGTVDNQSQHPPGGTNAHLEANRPVQNSNNQDNFPSAYVEFSQGAYPPNGQPILHLNKLGAGDQPVADVPELTSLPPNHSEYLEHDETPAQTNNIITSTTPASGMQEKGPDLASSARPSGATSEHDHRTSSSFEIGRESLA